MAKMKIRKQIKNFNFKYILSKPSLLKGYVIFWFEMIHKTFWKVTKFNFNLLSKRLVDPCLILGFFRTKNLP